MNKAEYKVNQKVWITVAESSPIGGGRHRGVIENIERDMFDNTILYLVRTCNMVIPARAGAIERIGKKKHNHDTEAEEAQP